MTYKTNSTNYLEMLILKILAMLQDVLRNFPRFERHWLWQPPRGVKGKHKVGLVHAMNQASKFNRIVC